MTDAQTVVIDTGSLYSKVGLAGDDAPISTLPSVLGREALKHSMCNFTGSKDVYIGNEIDTCTVPLKYFWPVERGIAKDWDNVERLWHFFLYNECHVNPEECNVLITETALNPPENREKCAQIMFESFSVQGLTFWSQAALAMFTSASISGLVVESGDGVTQIVPVFEGQAVKQGITRMEIAGKDVTECLQDALIKRGYTIEQSKVLREIKEKLATLRFNDYFEVEKAPDSEQWNETYVLPDGKSITVGSERFKASEIMFKPSLIGSSSEGVHELVISSIQKCDWDHRSMFYKNIHLSGGNSYLKGMRDRLDYEVTQIAPGMISTKVAAITEPNAVWSGGSIFASLSSTSQYMITKAMYEELGPQIVHKK